MSHNLFAGLPGEQLVAVLTSIGGAVLRHAIGPGWSWKEVALASATGAAFAIWIAPAIVAYFGFGHEVYGALCWAGGMVGLPVMRGIIGLALSWAKDPRECLTALVKTLRGGSR